MRLGILLSAALVAVADKRVVNVDGWEKSPLFSHAVVSGDTVYVSGMIGVDMSTMKLCPGGVYNQTLCAFANIETMLHAAGTSLDKVLDCTCFVGDLATDFDKMNEAYTSVFAVDPPARAAAGVAAVAWAREFKCTATRGRGVTCWARQGLSAHGGRGAGAAAPVGAGTPRPLGLLRMGTLPVRLDAGAVGGAGTWAPLRSGRGLGRRGRSSRAAAGRRGQR
ncbi:endoribonuclease [Aureococcus anophagefferens]|nr:endoribonuclease [Aureococcus anophagefferens]